MEGRPLDDAALVARACGGDLDAFGDLVERYSDLAFRTALVITRSPADAEDAVQEGFVAAFRALARFRQDAPLRPWLLRIVANAARNRRRSAGRRDALVLNVADAVRTGGAAPSPEATVEAAEERRALLRAVESLSDGDRLVVVCRHLLELDVAETAAVLGVREGTVKSRLHRALRRLRARLEAEGER
jgi:RNA polymerase sigma factor (sigma-70 family)